jgi:hypothetical protein
MPIIEGRKKPPPPNTCESNAIPTCTGRILYNMNPVFYLVWIVLICVGPRFQETPLPEKGASGETNEKHFLRMFYGVDDI